MKLTRKNLMPYIGFDVPHIVIEINQKCNIVCKACYKHKFNDTKSFEDVKKEIDFALTQRNLGAITLAGGEPTLHPELPQIISYIISKGIPVQILTNGYSLTPELLKKLHEAGLKELFLHIDSLQERPDAIGATNEKELNALRERLATMVLESGIQCSLSLTLYRKNFDEMVEFVKWILSSKKITRLLVTCCTDFDSIMNYHTKSEVLGLPYESKNTGHTLNLSDDAVKSQEIKKFLFEKIGMEPFAYTPSSESLDHERWLYYYSFAIIGDNDVSLLHLDKSFKRLVDLSYGISKKKGRPYSFASLYSPFRCVILCMLYAFFSLNPVTIIKTFSFLAKLLLPGRKIFHKSFTFQEGPSLSKDGSLSYCRDCPDATVRNGKLVPVCLSDFLIPLKHNEK